MAHEKTDTSKFTIVISSFGYKYGMIDNANLVFDVRGVPNPYYIESLREFTGNDKVIKDFVFANDVAQNLYHHLLECILYYIPFYVSNRKSDSLTIAIGCTGGKHRSVAFVNQLKDKLDEQYIVDIVHRDINQYE